MKNKTMVIVYELKTNERGLEDEFPIFNCDSLEEARQIFENKWGVKTSKQCMSYNCKNNKVLQSKYKIYRFDV